MRKILLTTMLVCVLSAQGFARDVYVFNSSGQAPLAQIQNLRCISFADNTATFYSGSGDVKNFDLGGFDYVLTYDPKVVAVSSVSSPDGIVISPDGRNVTVSSKSVIDRVEVFSSDGVKVNFAEPKALRAKIRISNASAGVYLVKVISGKETATRQIIIK